MNLVTTIKERLEQLHTDSVLSIGRTEAIAAKYDGSETLGYIAVGQAQSHTLIDRAVFDILAILEQAEHVI